jgi:hypothetical protein
MDCQAPIVDRTEYLPQYFEDYQPQLTWFATNCYLHKSWHHPFSRRHPINKVH